MSAFRVRAGQPAAPELARVLEAQLKAARTRLRRWSASPEDAFHEARRRLKKARAAARVARRADRKLAREINALAREAAKALSAVRDADVVRAAAAKLSKTCPDPAAAAALAAFADHARKAPAQDVDRATLAADAEALVTEAIERARKLGEADAPRKLFERAAARAIRRAQKAFHAARRASADGSGMEEARHEWRKRVKELWYVRRLLADVWPDDRVVDDATTDALGKKLGTERDYLLLAARLRKAARACGGASARDAAIAYVERRRAQVVAQADRLGRKLHDERAQAAPA